MASDRTSGDFGSKLRAARERRGITLRQIANATKISVGVLEALERNDISRLPGGIFGRGFVRSYAIEVGLNPEETIQDFIAQFPNDSVTAGHSTSEQTEDHEALESDRRAASTFIRLIGFSLLAILLLYLVSSWRFSSGRRASETRPSAPAAATTPATAISEPGAGDPATAPLTIGLLATGRCRLTATVDGETRVERVLEAGERQSLEVRRELVLTAGDAAAITMTINGADAKPLGRAGEEVTARVTPANFNTYLPAR